NAHAPRDVKKSSGGTARYIVRRLVNAATGTCRLATLETNEKGYDRIRSARLEERVRVPPATGEASGRGLHLRHQRIHNVFQSASGPAVGAGTHAGQLHGPLLWLVP